jgi:hypothetical protein
MGTYVPPEWPAGVHPPGSEDFESTAVGWLLEVVPPDYRLHGVLRRYPVALATMARYHAKACVEGARQGYRTARTELAGALPPHAIDTVLAAYRKEGARLAAVASGVDLIERALRGEVFVPEMGFAEPAEPGRKAAGAQGTDAEAGGRTRAEDAKAARAKDAEVARAESTARVRDTEAAGEADTAGEAEATGEEEAAGGRGTEGRGTGGRQAGRSRRGG